MAGSLDIAGRLNPRWRCFHERPERNLFLQAVLALVGMLAAGRKLSGRVLGRVSGGKKIRADCRLSLLAIREPAMTSDYSEHIVALAALHSQIAAAMREKRFDEADKLCAKAMSQLARLHVAIKRHSAPIK